MNSRSRLLVAAVLVVVTAIGAGAWLLAGAGPDQSRRHVVVDGVPLDEVCPLAVPAGERRPGVVVAHGYAGSARLMAPFGDTLAAQGYVVVLLDFTGHGAHRRPLPDDSASSTDATTALQRDLEVATAHLRGLPEVDPARVAVVGHSMGAGAVTRFALAHPDVLATVAISLPDPAFVPADRPARLLLLVGGLEFAGFRTAAERLATGSDRSAVIVPGVEHISVLYAPRTHREIVTWLGTSFGEPAGAESIPSPLRRPGAAGLLLLALLVGLYPLARLLLGAGPPARPQAVRGHLGRIVAVTAGAAGAGALVAPLAPTARLPLAIGGFVVGFTTVTGAVLLAYEWRRAGRVTATASPDRPSRVRLAVATPVLIGYAAVTICVPLHLGLTQALPVGARWWLLVFVWAGFAVLAYAADRVGGGNSLATLTVSAVVVLVLTCAAVVGLASSFLLLVVPLLAILFLWQAIWSAVLHRFAAPPGLIAAVGSLLVAWPVTIALPLIG